MESINGDYTWISMEPRSSPVGCDGQPEHGEGQAQHRVQCVKAGAITVLYLSSTAVLPKCMSLCPLCEEPVHRRDSQKRGLQTRTEHTIRETKKTLSEVCPECQPFLHVIIVFQSLSSGDRT